MAYRQEADAGEDFAELEHRKPLAACPIRSMRWDRRKAAGASIRVQIEL